MSVVKLRPEGPIARAHVALQSGKLREAEVACQQILVQNPTHHGALLMLGLVAIQTNNPKNALRLFQRAVASDPKSADSYMNLGIALRILGKKPEGREAMRQAVKLKPSSAQAQANLGRAELEDGDPLVALKHLKKATRSKPRSINILNALGTAQMRVGQTAEGLRTFRKAVSVDPKNADARRNLGTALVGFGDISGAVDAFAKAHVLVPADAKTTLHYATALAQARRTHEALPLFRKALATGADLPGGHNNYGLALKADCRFNEAVAAFEKALAASPDHPGITSNLADVLVLAGKAEQATKLLSDLPDSPNHDPITNQIGNILERLGEFDKASDAFRNVLKRNPKNIWAYAGLIDSHSNSLTAKDQAALTHLANAGDLPPREQVRADFALGQLHDSRGEFDVAFQHFSRGNRIRKHQNAFDIEKHRRRTDALITAFSHSILAKAPQLATASRLPVFVVGLPRSGTTLVESMLATHPLAFGAGELADLYVARHNTPHLKMGWAYPECIVEITRAHTARLAEWLIERRRELDPQAERVIDKTPAHSFDLGLAALLVDPLQVIHCRRNVLDTCLSIFTNDFGGQHAYAGDLRSLAAFVSDESRVMRHWETHLSLRSIDYENLVENPEATIRKLVSHIGLDWDAKILNHKDRTAPIATASRWQVRQPIYTSSVGRWKNYETFLAPLVEALEEFGVTP